MVRIRETFAEAFSAYFARILITALNEKWALIAAQTTTGFGSSLIMCPSEAGIECFIPPERSLDGRPGYIVQIWHPKKSELVTQVLKRISQCAMTCPTTAVFNALEGQEKVPIGGKIRYFGDGFEKEGKVANRRVWRVPVMEGEFVIEHEFEITKGVAGGNIIILGSSQEAAMKGAEEAVSAIGKIEGVILPFPGGICRCGSKVGSKTYKIIASTNEAYCPTLRDIIEKSLVPDDAKSAYEIVINGINLDCVKRAMKVGIETASRVEGIVEISAANFEGKLGLYKIYLQELIDQSSI